LATDRYGATVAATSRPAVYNQAPQEWWQKAYNNGQGDNYIGQPEYDTNRAAYSISIAVPIYTPDTREVIGVLHATYRTGALAAALLSVQFGQNSDAYILLPNEQMLEGKGNYVATDKALLNYHNTLPRQTYGQVNLSAVNRLISEAVVSSSDPLNGRVVANLGWSVLVLRDSAQALQPVNTASQTTLLTSLVVLLLTVLFGVVVAQVLAAPITQLTGVAIRVASGDMTATAKIESQDEIGTLAHTFNDMTAQLRDQINTLEQRVSDRTRDLERQTLRLRAAAEVARDATSARNVDELLDRAAQLIRDRFNLYHVGIFLVDRDRTFAVLRASPTDAGREMIANNHRLRIGEQGIVGRVAATGEPRIALDTGVDSVYFSNPLLPATHSEMSLPLKTGEGVVGVLDVQSDQPEAFTQDDIAVMQVMTDQLSIALERTRLLQQVETSLQELERTYSQFTAEAWRSFARGGQFASGYKFDSVRLESITEMPREAKAALERGTGSISRSTDKKTGLQTAIVPIRLRGQTIGVVNIRFQGNDVPEESLAMVEQAADRLAIALETARLLAEARQRAQRDSLISELSGRVRATLDLDTVLKTAAQELQQAFQLKEAEVRLGRPKAPASGNEAPENMRRNGKRRE
jgi:GAF domain-containing protein/HAMP domain-containing protein